MKKDHLIIKVVQFSLVRNLIGLVFSGIMIDILVKTGQGYLFVNFSSSNI